MRNHNEKQRDMLRSILPSKKRKSARQETRILHRAQRSRCNHKLKAYRGSSEDCYDLYDELGEDHIRYYHPGNSSMRGQGDWDYIVEERRGADKLNHFLRWAYETTKDLDPGDRYNYFKKILPDNLIGRHALSHMRMWDSTYVYNRDGVQDLPYHMRDGGGTEYKRVKKRNRELFIDSLRDLAHGPKEDRVKFNQFLSKLTYEKIVSYAWLPQRIHYSNTKPPYIWYRRVPETETTLYNRLFHGKGDIYSFAQFCDNHRSFKDSVQQFLNTMV